MAYESGVARWSSPMPYSDELVTHFDEVYMDSPLRESGARTAWKTGNKERDVMSTKTFIRNLTVMSTRIKSRLNWRQLAVLDSHSFTVGEVAFVLARKRSMSFGLEDIEWYGLFMEKVPKYQTIGWALLLLDMGLKEDSAFAAYELFAVERVDFDSVASFYNKGICSPEAIVLAHQNGVDSDLIHSLIAGS